MFNSKSTGRIESLRPHLIRLGLFPRRNSENAPIRMEELRALVRKWNLHHKRNFWRENPTKDDVVVTLHRHIKHMKVVSDSIESKKAERREADRKRYLPKTTRESDGPPWTLTSSKCKPPKTNTSGTCLYHEGCALRSLNETTHPCLPTDSVDNGIIYMSRWGKQNSNINIKNDGPLNHEVENTSLPDNLEGKQASPQNLDKGDINNDVDVRDSKSRTYKMHLEQKSCLALLNMTMRDQVRPTLFGEKLGLTPFLCFIIIIIIMMTLTLPSALP